MATHAFSYVYTFADLVDDVKHLILTAYAPPSARVCFAMTSRGNYALVARWLTDAPGLRTRRLFADNDGRPLPRDPVPVASPLSYLADGYGAALRLTMPFFNGEFYVIGGMAETWDYMARGIAHVDFDRHFSLRAVAAYFSVANLRRFLGVTTPFRVLPDVGPQGPPAHLWNMPEAATGNGNAAVVEYFIQTQPDIMRALAPTLKLQALAHLPCLECLHRANPQWSPRIEGVLQGAHDMSVSVADWLHRSAAWPGKFTPVLFDNILLHRRNLPLLQWAYDQGLYVKRPWHYSLAVLCNNGSFWRFLTDHDWPWPSADFALDRERTGETMFGT